MIAKCVFLVFFASTICISEIFASGNMYNNPSCPHPRIENGRVRIRQRTKLVKFTCLPQYQLVGNRYATCMHGVWDVPMPVCIRSGCVPFPPPKNGVQIKNHYGAWLVTFCLPGYELHGSEIIYCDGYKWNASIPDCVLSTKPTVRDISCNFDDPANSLCGWMQDELHDFDWRRWNKRTPSFFARTGPSYDHTLGDGQNGYFMYLEGTGVEQNLTARLVSPVVDKGMSADGCFSFYYHMYGRNMGGLRVYQKPDSVQLQQLLQFPPEDKKKYILFEEWGNQGDKWIGAAPQLHQYQEDFQIVIEGVQGESYFNDIAFDDVAILQGANCTKFRSSLAPVITGSCQNRCTTEDVPTTDCKCSFFCELNSSCCEDYYEQCIWNNNNAAMTTEADETSPTAKPQTEKLILSTTSTTTSTTTPTTSTTTQPPTTTQQTTKITKPTTTRKTTKPTTMTKRTTTVSTTPKTTTQKIVPTTKKNYTGSSNQPTRKVTQKTTIKLLPSTTVKTIKTTVVDVTTKDYRDIDRNKSRTEVQIQAFIKPKPEKQSSTLKTTIITIVVLAVFAGLIYFAVISTTTRGWITLARLRGRATHDPEVRYLNSNDDDL